jgi:MFS family permease
VIPDPIRRNTWLLFAAHVTLSVALSTAGQLSSLIVYALTGTAALAGVPSALLSVVVASIGYPAGRMMDRRGRRPGLVMGFVIGALGSALIGLAVATQAFAAYLAAVVVFSAGVGIGLLSRAAVADMYPAARRASAVGLVVTGGLVGGIAGPSLVALGDRVAREAGWNPLALPWVFPGIALAATALILTRLRPDPRNISMSLSKYFPDADEPGAATPTARAGGPSVREILASPPTQAAMVALACAHATMIMLMATASLMLSLHGHPTTTISIVVVAHVVGMFGLSVPAGRLADRVGRRPVLIGGALLSASSGLLFSLGVRSAVWAAAAFYLVGIGWCLAQVAGSAMLGDVSTPSTRARVMGISDVATNVSAVVAALLAGVLLARGGELTVGALAAVWGSVPLLAIARLRPARVAVTTPVAEPGGK